MNNKTSLGWRMWKNMTKETQNANKSNIPTSIH